MAIASLELTKEKLVADLVPVRRALISVSDKAGLDRLAEALGQRGVELV